MKKYIIGIIVTLFTIFLICGFVIFLFQRTGCKLIGGVGPNFELKLQNGYLLGVSNKHSVDICDSKGRFVVEPHIDKLNTKGSLIFGVVYEEGILTVQGYKAGPMVGYFILDTNDGSLIERLEKDEWLKQLELRGIKYEPKLIHPSFFFNWIRDR